MEKQRFDLQILGSGRSELYAPRDAATPRGQMSWVTHAFPRDVFLQRVASLLEAGTRIFRHCFHPTDLSACNRHVIYHNPGQ